MERTWRLFVDETGRFGHDRGVAAAGLLVDDRYDLDRASFRRRLLAAAPGAPWPLHAAFVHRPIMFVLWRLAARERNAVEPDPYLDGLVDEIAAILETHAKEGFDAALSVVRAGKEPKIAGLVALEGSVRAVDLSPSNKLWRLARDAASAIDSVLRDVTELARSKVPDECLVTAIASAETEPPTNLPLADDTARYLLCLETLLERAADVVARIDGRHLIQVHVLTRDILDPVLRVPAPLFVRHLAPLAQKLGVAGRVRVRIDSVPRYDAGATPGLVWADSLAFRAREAIDSLLRDVRSVERRIEGATGMRLASGAPLASHVAASGAAREAVDGARQVAGLTAPPGAAPGRRAWAIQQATEWIAVLGLKAGAAI